MNATFELARVIEDGYEDCGEYEHRVRCYVAAQSFGPGDYVVSPAGYAYDEEIHVRADGVLTRKQVDGYHTFRSRRNDDEMRLRSSRCH